MLLVAEVLREKADGALASLASSSSCSHQDGDLTQFTFDDRVDEKALRNAAAITNSNRPKGCSAISVVSGLASNNVGKAAADINSTNKEGGVESRHWTSLLTAGAPASPSTTPFAWDDPPTHSAMRARTATLLSTSSTSGTPKQVRMSHYQFVAMTVVILDGFRRGLFASQSGNVTAPSKIGTAPPSLYHVSMTRIAAQSMACVIYPILRMPVYISESPLFVDILDCVIKLQLTGLFNSSHFIVALLKEEGLRKRWKDCGKSLRDLSLASVPVDDSMVEGFLEEWRRETGKDLEVRVSYGMTE